ncbi:hypothetical protein MSAN_00964000 [Mycena sanguinolenta]|uniref:Uncharacterized protein n=1 Tax=Mycena sanguinolenta TaxID=230812 RepID=A0A8H7DCG6_9AGAR|nr:hypothetical protein MSAN_00964000 [Mycena sanguinolenta]
MTLSRPASPQTVTLAGESCPASQPQSTAGHLQPTHVDYSASLRGGTPDRHISSSALDGRPASSKPAVAPSSRPRRHLLPENSTNLLRVWSVWKGRGGMTVGARVFYWTANGVVVYGTIQQFQKSRDGTILVIITTDTGSSITLPASCISVAEGTKTFYAIMVGDRVYYCNARGMEVYGIVRQRPKGGDDTLVNIVTDAGVIMEMPFGALHFLRKTNEFIPKLPRDRL